MYLKMHERIIHIFFKMKLHKLLMRQNATVTMNLGKLNAIAILRRIRTYPNPLENGKTSVRTPMA